MSRKNYWIISFFALILVLGYMFITVIEGIKIRKLKKLLENPTIIYIDETKDKSHVEQLENQIDKDLLLGETNEVGHLNKDHHNRFAETSNIQSINTQLSDIEPVLTPSQKEKRDKYWTDQGIDPPPEGHGYVYDKDGKISGLYKYNKPRFKVGWSKTENPGQDYHKLTEAEWIRYHALRHIVGGSVLTITQEMMKQLDDDDPVPKENYLPGVQELARVWMNQLNKKASGRTRKVSAIVAWSRKPTNKELELIDRKSDELLESLKRPKREQPRWQPSVKPIIKELETAINAEKGYK